jgi:NitT/TauT family transport system permease protein/taurine transport system permease protein/sulfonate transport system permease protein
VSQSWIKINRASFKRVWQGLAAVAAVILLWHVASVTGLFGRIALEYCDLLLPTPAKVAQTIVVMLKSGYLLDNLLVSLVRVGISFGLAILIGVPLGVGMAVNDTTRNLAQPFVRFFSPIPALAWVPLAILWFGLGDQAAIFIVTLAAVFPIIFSTIQGVHDIDRHLLDAARMMGADSCQVFRRVMMPSLAPYLVTGFRNGMSNAWRVVVAAEMVGVPKGIGYMLTVGRGTGETGVTIVTIIVLGVVMLVVEELIFGPLENRTRFWRPGGNG